MDLADGQGRAHALLTILFNPGPPPPLTMASPFCSVIAGCRRKGEAGLPVPPPTACPSSSHGRGEQGPARGSPLLPPLPGACWNSGPSRRWPNRYVGTPSMSIGELDLLLHGGGRRLIFLSQKQSAVLQHYTKEPTRCHPLYIQRVRTSVWHEDPLLFLETKQIPYSDMAPLGECDL